ncbi:MAG TPA: ABC transporter permease [Patescibacteria group bacterium]|nr:ABC transporter permease [Patescibacteria group bacterium]
MPLQRLLALAALVILFVFFSLIAPPFRTWDNFVSILLATAVNGVLAMGVTFVIISGGIDLSVGTMMTFCTVVLGLALINAGMPVPVAILAALVSGAFAGAVTGTIIAKAKIPPFIATLGMLNVARGLALVLSDLRPIHFAPRPEYHDLLMGMPLLGIPNVVWVMFGAAIVAHFVLAKTVLGRYTFALGSNEEATRLSGVNVDRWKIAVYGVCGMMAGLAAVLIAGRMNSAQPAVGMGYELDAIAAAVIGGTSLRGGEGSIVGTVIGAFIISTLAIGLAMMGVPDEWRLVVTGLVIIGAVWLDILRRRSRV